MAFITFTSDFGLTDPYVGIVHGVIASIAPTARVIDLTHGVPPQDVYAGALALYVACRWFPAGTIHLAVVDPGVGTPRRALLLRTADAWFVGPDNGLFGLVAPAAVLQGCWELTNRRYWLEAASATFHGRDIFGPAAAHLAAGVPPEELGAPAASPLEVPDLRLQDVGPGETTGRVIAADHFGNLITNVRASEHWEQALASGSVDAWLVDRPVQPARTYGEAPIGTLVLLAGSSGLLEVAVPNGSAAATTGLGPGAAVRVRAR